jgi:hypothetical protein
MSDGWLELDKSAVFFAREMMMMMGGRERI